ncbi:carbon-nitrogen hydrolase family protein [Chloroflexota bacterium]
MTDMIKLAAVQMEPKLMAIKTNLDKIICQLRLAADKGTQLIVFPECALTGYVFTSRKEAEPFAETIPGPSTGELSMFCRQLNLHIIVGLLEIENTKCFNAAVLIGPQGLIGKYRKVHLPFLGVDRFLDPGDQAFQVHKTQIGNIGIQICYDCNFPESSRVMALQGADILALPTNWPEGRQKVARHVVVTRAFENKVHLIAVNRVGKERNTNFIGSSKIINSFGDTITEANADSEETIYAEVNLSEARQKHIVFKAGEFEVDFINDRRPEFYGEITKSTSHKNATK